MVSPKWQMRVTRWGPQAPMLRSVENNKGVFDYRLILFMLLFAGYTWMDVLSQLV
jgi:hypothetical protein